MSSDDEVYAGVDSSGDEENGSTSGMQYNQGNTKRRRLTKEQIIYGVFGRDEPPSRFVQSNASKLDVPVQFVQSTTINNENSSNKGLDSNSGPVFEPASNSSPHQGLGFAPASGSSSHQGLGFAPASGSSSHQGLGFKPATDSSSHQGLGFAPATDSSSHQGLGFAPASDSSSHQGLGFAPASDSSSHQGLGFKPATDSSSLQGLGFKPATDSSSHQGLGFAPASGSSSHQGFNSSSNASEKQGVLFAPPAQLTLHQADQHESQNTASHDDERIETIKFQRLVKGSSEPSTMEARELVSEIESGGNRATSTTSKRSKMSNKSKKTKVQLSEWEMSSSGMGRKLLEKFGYKGGALGKRRKGISKPIQVKTRPEGLGIGFGGFKEAVHLNREIHQEAFGSGEQVDDNNDEEASPISSENYSTYKDMWKAFGGDGQSSKRRKPKSMKQFVDEMHQKAVSTDKSAAKVVIIDHRSGKPRIVTNMDKLSQVDHGTDSSESDSDDDASSSSSSSDGDAANTDDINTYKGEITNMKRFRMQQKLLRRRAPRVHIGKELSHNLRALIGLCEAQIASADSKHQNANRKIVELQQERSEIETVIDLENQQMDRLQRVIQQIEAIHTETRNKVGVDSVRYLLDRVKGLKEQFQVEYVEYALHRVVGALVLPLMQTWATTEWKSYLTQLVSMLQKDPGVALQKTAQVQQYIHTLRSFRSILKGEGPSTHSLFDHVMEAAVIPQVVATLTSSWNVKDSEVGLGIVSNIQPFVSKTRLREILGQSVLPILTRAISSWSPDHDHLIHLWMFPWLPTLGEILFNLFPSIRNKMETWMMKSDWSPEGENGKKAIAMLKPWIGQWSDASIARLTRRCVVPHLIKELRKFAVNPSNQQGMHVIETVFEWEGVLSKKIITCLLVGELFPKWLNTLSNWVASTTSQSSIDRNNTLRQVAEWYLGWKSLFPNTILDCRSVLNCFAFGLRILQLGMSGKAIGVQVYGSFSNLNFEALESSVPDAPDMASNHSTAVRDSDSLRGSVEPKEVSLKEALEAFATKAGVSFTMHEKRKYEGKPLYKFGKFTLLIDRDTVKVETKSSSGGQSEWLLVTSFHDMATQSLA